VATLSPAERIIARCLPSFGDILFACVLFGVVFGLQGRALGPDGDAGWSLRIGLQTLSSGLPRNEFLLSTTAGQPVVFWEWLAQVAYALAYRLAGLNGVVALAGGIVAGTGAGLYVAIRRRGTPLLLALALAIAGIGLTSITWTARAQLFSLPLTLWWSQNLWSYWRTGNPRRLWYFLPVMALLANLHGGFLAGIILLATAVAVAWLFPGDSALINRRHLTYALGGTLAATLLTPWGFALPAHILAYMRNPLITRYTQEYQSPDFHSLAGLLFLALALLLASTWLYSATHASSNSVGAPGGRQRGDVTTTGGVLRAGAPPTGNALALAHAAVWTVLACVSVRFVPLWALVVLPLLAGALVAARTSGAHSDFGRQPQWRMRLTTWVRRVGAFSKRLEVVDNQVGRGVWSALAVAVVVVALAGGGHLPGASSPTPHAQFDATLFPVQAAQRLHAEGLPAGRGFTTYEWGGYLDFALPEYHVFIDSRSDAYSQQLLQDYATILSLGPGWRALLREYGIHWALLPATSPLAQVLALSPGWRCAAADSVGVATLCVLSGT
ncbi:MAG: hypothetical protein ACRDHP_03155, partial [Ktedonobacterales bacterium]